MRSHCSLSHEDLDVARFKGGGLAIRESQKVSVIFHREGPSAFSRARPPNNNALRHGEGKVNLINWSGVSRIVDGYGELAGAAYPDFFRGEGQFETQGLGDSGKRDSSSQEEAWEEEEFGQRQSR